MLNISMLNVQHLEEELNRCNMRQCELADKIKVSESTMSRYFNGTRKPNVRTLFDMATALNTTPEYLAGVECHEPPDTAFAEARIAIKSYCKKWTNEQRKELINALIDDV